MPVLNIFEEIKEMIRNMIKEQETSTDLGRLEKEVMGAACRAGSVISVGTVKKVGFWI